MGNRKTAAILLIGDELLSGRTRDINLQTIANFLQPYGIQVGEARVVTDSETGIIAALNALRASYDYVFTTGGLGPTHDDVTADCVAITFGKHIDIRDDARALLSEHYEKIGLEFTDARKRMARIPDDASLILNPVSTAPGFQLENVFVLAGIPSVVRAMLQDVGHRLETGEVVHARSLRIPGAKEGEIAEPLAGIAKVYETLSIGSYPWYLGPENTGVQIVVRGTEIPKIDGALTDIGQMFADKGLTVEAASAD